MHRFISPCAAFCAVGLIAGASIAAAQETARNCPKADDQTILVATDRPTAFRLSVTDLGAGQISIFQYPLGGILQTAGPTPLDFVFVPQVDFNGTTALTYRLTPPLDCGRSVELHKVTLAGGTSTDTAAGLSDAQRRNLDLCGAGIVPAILLPAISLGRVARRRR